MRHTIYYVVGVGFQVAGYGCGHEFTTAWDTDAKLCRRRFEEEIVDVLRERCDSKASYQSEEDMADYDRS